MEVDSTMAQILLIQRLVLRFAMEPETLPVFIEWARKNHDDDYRKAHGKSCDDPDCQYSNPKPAKWDTILNQAFFIVLTASNIEENGG